MEIFAPKSMSVLNFIFIFMINGYLILACNVGPDSPFGSHLMSKTTLMDVTTDKYGEDQSNGFYDDPFAYRFTVSSTDIDLADLDNLECFLTHKYCSQINQIIFSDKLCNCSPDCFVYGDCCWDSVRDNLTDHSLYECVSTSETHSPSYYMVTYCPIYWADNETRCLCEKTTSYHNDPLLHVPVTSTSTLTVYRNIFCAICNNIIDILPWTPHEICNNGNHSYLVEFDPPKSLPSPKTCEWRGIFECHNVTFRQKCVTYYAPVQRKNKKGIEYIYKNKFCAFCSGLKAHQLECTTLDGIENSGQTVTSNETELIHSRSKKKKQSLAILLDLDFSKGGVIVGTEERCPTGQVYDPWKKKCRIIQCGKLFYYRNGICVKKETFTRNAFNNLQVSYNNFLNSTCSKISIDADKFSIHENGTIVINKDGLIITPGNYEMLPNSTILICAPQVNSARKFSQVQSYLTTACLSISIFCLIIKLLLFIFLSEYKKLPMIIVFYLSLSLLLAQLLFLVGTIGPSNYFCIGIAIFMHYFYLASVFCTNALAFDIWKTFTNMKHLSLKIRKTHLIYSILYCWGLPMIIVIISIICEWAFHSTFSPQYGSCHCWICNRYALLIFFAVPLGLVLIINIIFYTITAKSIYKTSKSSKIARKNAKNKNYVRFFLYIKIALIMGFTWIFGFISAYSNMVWLWNFFIILNGLQGVFILLAFTRIAILKQLINKISSRKNFENNSLMLTSSSN
ncbi:uncharacterized protein LOC111627732 [Centruroides sculpturatus]|uniref:uncharacterized protein LOC111627732 n=1 Tax=Centruroides sculpturatus TaxID=218467 RepID=UPI000C6CE2FD|nr:uncharacterized protein LOC111627732 [Centruroides sculpturatus]